MIEGILFDFDGVIAESIDVKTQAFCELFADYPQWREEIVRYHRANGGIARDIKIAYIYREMFKQDLSHDRLQALCRKYSELVKDNVINSALVNGTEEFLEHCFGKHRMFVVSGTPEGEMREIVAAKKLDKYFNGVYGSPRTKAQLVRMILELERWSKDNVIFLGDSINDLQAADELGVPFFARVTSPLEEWANDQRIKAKFKDLMEFRDIFDRTCAVHEGE